MPAQEFSCPPRFACWTPAIEALLSYTPMSRRGLHLLDAGQSRPFDADAVERITRARRAKLAALKAGNR
jgi:hypothetical protein